MATELTKLLSSLHRALDFAYSGSAENGSFLRNGGGEYVPSVFMTFDNLKRELLVQLRNRDEDAEQTADRLMKWLTDHTDAEDWKPVWLDEVRDAFISILQSK